MEKKNKMNRIKKTLKNKKYDTSIFVNMLWKSLNPVILSLSTTLVSLIHH